MIDSTYSHKVSINLSIMDNKDLWPLLHNPITKYSAARIDTTSLVKYFTNGIILINAADFLIKYKECSNYIPISPWVLLFSLSAEVEANGSTIIRYRNRTSLVCSCQLDNIREGHNSWPDPGLSLDPRMIEYTTSHINWRDGKVTIRAKMPQGLSLSESPYDFVRNLHRYTDPLVENLKLFRLSTSQDPFSTQESRDLMHKMMYELLLTTGYMSPTAESNRQRLISVLNLQEDPHAYVVKGVAFTNKKEYDDMLATRNGDEALTLRVKHDRPILERLLSEFPGDCMSRLREVDPQILDLPPVIEEAALDFTIGLTDEEYSNFTNEYMKDPAGVTAKYRAIAKARWNEVHSK